MKKRLLSFLSIIFVVLLLISCGEKEFQVDFDLNGGTSEVQIKPQKIKENDFAAKPIDPTKEGYIFIGWFLDDGALENEITWDFNEDVVTKNMTLVAVWLINEYTISFDALGGTPNPEEQIIQSGNSIAKPLNPSKEDYLFTGWYYTSDNEDVLWDFDELVTEDIFLFAKWESTLGYVNADFDAINLTVVDDKIVLPSRGAVNNTRISWKSDNPTIVTTSGIVNPPLKSFGDTDVTLTATINYANEVYTRDYLVTIPAKGEAVITSEQELAFFNLTNEYEVADAEILTFFVDDGYLPYLDIESFLLLLDGLIYADELDFTYNDTLLEISYEVTDEEENETYYYEAVIDFYEGTIYTEKMSFFNNYIKTTATDYSEGINYVDYYVEEGDAVTFNLTDYQVDMIIYEIEDTVYYLMPYNFLSMIFTSETYYNFYYNGENFYGFYAIPSNQDEDDEYNTYETIKNSSFNNNQIPKDIALSSFHQMAFIFDHYFGLRYNENYEIEHSFYEKLTPSINSYLDTTSKFNTTIRSFILKTLDELHSSYRFPGFYNRASLTYPLYIDDLGPKTLNWYEDGLWEIQDAIDYWHYDDREGFKFLDDEKETAVIYLDEFLTASVDEEKSSENDSDAYMRETIEAILLENPNVKNVGVDLSYNTGGNIGALLRVLGFITEKPIEMSYKDPLTNQNSTYFIELDQDAYEDFNWFFITSPVTFSAANLMTAIVKNQNLGPILGSISGGGAASITPFVLAEGSMISISSNSLLSIRTLNSDGTYTFTDIENGIEPDLFLAVKDTQNPEKILELLEEYYN